MDSHVVKSYLSDGMPIPRSFYRTERQILISNKRRHITVSICPTSLYHGTTSKTLNWRILLRRKESLLVLRSHSSLPQIGMAQATYRASGRSWSCRRPTRDWICPQPLLTPMACTDWKSRSRGDGHHLYRHSSTLQNHIVEDWACSWNRSVITNSLAASRNEWLPFGGYSGRLLLPGNTISNEEIGR